MKLDVSRVFTKLDVFKLTGQRQPKTPIYVVPLFEIIFSKDNFLRN